MFQLKGQNAVITGASRGLGLEIAKSLAAQGANLHLVSTKQDVIDEVASHIGQEFGVEAKGWAMDVSQSSSVTEVMGNIVKEVDSLDILVNNAGITRDGLLMRMKDEDFQKVLEVNLSSVFYCSKAVLRTMIKQKYGRVINISSIIGVRGQAGQANYAASKAGIIGFTKSFAKEVATRGITCNAIAPGFIQSDMTDELTEEQKTGILKDIPSGRMGDAHEVGALTAYLASREAGYVTGQVLGIDGGLGI
jgi:3-oxoacyl-[acyl-carrier protein] reductase